MGHLNPNRAHDAVMVQVNAAISAAADDVASMLRDCVPDAAIPDVRDEVESIIRRHAYYGDKAEVSSSSWFLAVLDS